MAFPTLDEVVQQLRTISEDDTVSADSKIATLEVDSLDILEWVFEIEEQADMSIDESLYDPDSLEAATVRDFYERIEAAAASA